MKGIPDDTPENSVQGIIDILHEEASQLSAQIHVAHEKQDISMSVTIDLSLKDRSCRMMLIFAPSEMLPLASGTIGSGFISGEKKWRFELLPKDMFLYPCSPPFRWGMFYEQDNHTKMSPRHILDGVLLRQWLRHSLLPRLSSSPESTEDFC
jgi:hypothetical protein